MFFKSVIYIVSQKARVVKKKAENAKHTFSAGFVYFFSVSS